MEGILALGIPIIALMIPIVAILTKHQREMAILLAQRGGTTNAETEALRREVAELKDLVRQQTIALDGRPPMPPVDVVDRLRA